VETLEQEEEPEVQRPRREMYSNSEARPMMRKTGKEPYQRTGVRQASQPR
jgi:hypothetical protein